MEKAVVKLPGEVEMIINALEQNGHSAFVVGGCVRDSIMGKDPDDWDITTSASPDETAEVFKDHKLVVNGIKHGTVGVVVDHRLFEITTFRTEGAYSDNRHPDSVTFVKKIEDDLARRDFTVNAMAYSPARGLVDPFCGKSDIDKKLIKCVGDAKMRFDEDALRIMRAIRFSSKLNFKICQATAAAIHEKKSLLKNVAAERIRVELEKTLLGENVFEVLREFDDVIFEVIPELEKTKNVAQNCPYHIFDVWEHIIKSVSKSEADKTVRLTMLLHDVAKPLVKTTDENGVDHFKTHAVVGSKITENILKRLRFDKATTQEITALVLHHDDRMYLNNHNVPKYTRNFGYDFLRKLDKVSRADIKAQNEKYLDRLDLCDEFIKKLDECEKNDICVSVNQLAVNGNDLKNLGFVGKDIGRMLEELLEKVIDNELENIKEILMEYAKKRGK